MSEKWLNALMDILSLPPAAMAYEKGHHLFFTKNALFLPCGPVEDSEIWLRGLHPRVRCLISTLAITFNLADLAPGYLGRLSNTEPDCKGNPNPNRRKHPEDCICLLAAAMEKHLQSIWHERLSFMVLWDHITHYRCSRGNARHMGRSSNTWDSLACIDALARIMMLMIGSRMRWKLIRGMRNLINHWRIAVREISRFG